MTPPANHNVDFAALARDLRHYREETGQTVRDVGEIVQAGASTVNRVERAKSVPNTRMFLALCDLLDKDPITYFLPGVPYTG